jgi:uncharacterized phage protein gp47/JayE
MITKITTVEELKQIFSETLLNQTDKITKVSPGSVVNGIAYGVAKLAQKTLKDVAVIEAHLFPDSAVGQYLDTLAELKGVAPRQGALKSSGFVRVVGAIGTVYLPGTHYFSGSGQKFDVVESTTIPSEGYTYVKVSSQNTGISTNVDALTVNSVTPVPSGHEYVINEFSMTGGRNFEDDDLFRMRIKDEINVLARTTISYLEQVFRKYNSNVLRVFNQGLDNVGDLCIGIASVNGVDFTVSELANILVKAEQYLSLCELKPDGLQNYGIKLKNTPYFAIDISCRVDIDNSYSIDEVRKQCQIALSKVVDWRFWKQDEVIEWIDLINAVKSVPGVNLVLDNYFYPNTNFTIPRGYLPRFRGFLMMNINGNILENVSGTMNPVYYPAESDFAFQITVLKSL